MLANLRSGLLQSGHVCVILTTSSSSDSRQEKGHCLKLRHQGHKIRWKAIVKRVLYSHYNRKQINRCLNDVQPELIHYHIGPLLDDAFGHLLNTSLPSVLTLHSVIDQKLFAHSTEKRFIVDLLNRVEEIVCVSAAVEKTLKRFARPGAAVKVIPNGVSVERSVYVNRRKERQVLFAGRLWEIKGLDILIRALADLHDIRLLVAGDGPERERLLHLIEQLHLSNIVLLGDVNRSQLQRFMQESSVLVVPSRSEGLGMVALEAMTCGCPVIAFDVGGLKEIIINGKNGLLVPPENTEALAKAIEMY